MRDRVSRWGCLAIFAATNLVFWVAVAIAVGLIAGDVIDLGVETFLRGFRATAEAVIEQAPTRLAEAGSQPTARATEPQKPQSTEVGEGPTPTPLSPETPEPPRDTPMLPTKTSAAGPDPGALPTLQPGLPSPTGAPATTEPGQEANATAPPPPPTVTPGPTATPVSQPLLLSNPTLASLLNIGAEMERSAPGRPVQIRYAEDALNHEISTYLEAFPSELYQNVYLQLRRNQITLTGEIIAQELVVGAEVIGTLVAQDCRPLVVLESVSTTGTQAPIFYRNQIERMLQDAMSWSVDDFPLCIEQVVLEEGRMTIYGSRR
jgi:hypothetical protein